MGKLQEFLLKDYEIPTEEHEVPVTGFPEPFIVKTISEEKNTEIRNSCMRSIRGKNRRMEKELDTNLYNARFLATVCIEPNFNDAALQKKFGVMGAEKLVGVLLNPGQFVELLDGAQQANGFTDINEEIDEAKNLSPGAETAT